jgi:hypothetical protein
MTTPGLLHLSFEFRVEMDGDLDAFHEHGNVVMDELLKLEECNDDVHDATVSTDAGRRTIMIEFDVRSENEPAALAKALDVTRAAVHAAGGSTPGWPRYDEVKAHGPEYHKTVTRIGPASVMVEA